MENYLEYFYVRALIYWYLLILFQIWTPLGLDGYLLIISSVEYRPDTGSDLMNGGNLWIKILSFIKSKPLDFDWDFISNKKHFVTTLCIINISSAKSWMNKVFFTI